MEEEETSNRYSATNDIRGLDGAADFGIIQSPNSDDVNWSNAAQGQGGERGKKPKGEGYKIYNKTITALNGESNVGKFSFHNLVVDFSNGGQGQGCREFEDICHNVGHNKITADNRSTKIGFENFSNVNYNCKTTSTKDHGKAAGGKAGGGSSRSQANILKNKITACNGSSYVGMFNFHNAYINGGQGQGGFLKHKGISHNIDENTIIAVNSRRVGIQDFGNIKYYCESIINRFLHFFGL
ncbi:hypothetical protein ACE6H2_001911 [Prunus campanulata]